MGKRRKYKTEAEAKAAHYEAIKRWRAKNPDYQNKYRLKNRDAVRANSRRWKKANPEKVNECQRKWHKRIMETMHSKAADMSAFEARFTALEAEVKEFKKDKEEILLTLEEVLKDNKRLENLIKWGKK